MQHTGGGGTCASYCEEQGMWCEAAWDDAGGGCKRASSGKPPQCGVRRKNQICACRRACEDHGPWSCVEAGCPARQVTCSILSVACDVRFAEIWDKPPPGVADLLVEQACPLTCGRCISEAPQGKADQVRALLGL